MAVKINLGFNLDWEASNWYQTICADSSYVLKDGSRRWPLGKITEWAVGQVKCELGEREAIPKIKPLVERALGDPEISEFMRNVMDAAETKWAAVEGEYFSRLSKMLDIPQDKFLNGYGAYFTLGVRCPFSPDAFMFNGFMKFVDNAAHEIMHIEFLRGYSGYCKEKGLSEEQTGHLKELLTVLLNVDMADLLSKPDRGYENHQTLRETVRERYEANGGAGGNFSKFLDEAIELIKKAD